MECTGGQEAQPWSLLCFQMQKMELGRVSTWDDTSWSDGVHYKKVPILGTPVVEEKRDGFGLVRTWTMTDGCKYVGVRFLSKIWSMDSIAGTNWQPNNGHAPGFHFLSCFLLASEFVGCGRRRVVLVRCKFSKSSDHELPFFMIWNDVGCARMKPFWAGLRPTTFLPYF